MVCSQNHDQVGNRKNGDRLTTLVDFETLKLSRWNCSDQPLPSAAFLWVRNMGRQILFCISSAITDPELNRLVREGRQKEFEGFYGLMRNRPRSGGRRDFSQVQAKLETMNETQNAKLFNYYRR